MKKSDVLDIFNRMPEDVDINALIYTLWFRHKLELAEADADAGNLTPHEGVKAEIKGWLTFPGRSTKEGLHGRHPPTVDS